MARDKGVVESTTDAGIRCPECDGKVRVLNSVQIQDQYKNGRYRECKVCGLRFYTEENIVRVTTPKNG